MDQAPIVLWDIDGTVLAAGVQHFMFYILEARVPSKLPMPRGAVHWGGRG